jgi:ComF family protein
VLRPCHLSALLGPLLDLLFPPLCHHCKTFIPHAGAVHLCPGCLAETRPVASPFCSCCGEPFLTMGGSDHRCGPCQTNPPHFLAARAACIFAGPVRELIHRFKYQRRSQLRRPLALLTAERLADFVAGFQADLLLPIPLHRKRLQERGFNQAVLLGELLSRQWRVPMCRSNLARIRWTEPQVGLTAGERLVNVRGAFALERPAAVEGRRVLLIDDVYTTGSTVRECARILRRDGKAAAVGVVTVARAMD